MPDAHSGLGATVGSVIATRGAVIPLVGADIGCGTIAAEFDASIPAVLWAQEHARANRADLMRRRRTWSRSSTGARRS
jgi:tRNA-splicing ligase RtcB